MTMRPKNVHSWVLPFPRVVRIEPAAACNLTCSHCPTGTIDMARGVMRWETFERVLESLKKNFNLVKVVVLYHGGEPFLSKNFFKMVRAAKSATGAMVKTVSNGLLMSEAMACECVTSELDIIEFSIDGETAIQNDLIRRGANYKQIVANVRHLIETKSRLSSTKPSILLSTTQFIDPAVPHCQQTAKPPAFLLEEFRNELASEALAGIKSTFAMQWPHMNVAEDIYSVKYDSGDTEIRTSCDHVINTVTVRWNGDVVPCCYDLTSRAVMGNVMESDLEVIWNDTKYLDLRAGIDRGEFIEPCASCNVVKPHAYLVPKQSVSI